MIFTKPFLQHELQNIFMLLGCYLEDVKFKDKNTVLDLIKMASLFVEHEDLFLGKKTKFFLQDVELSDICDVLIATNQEYIQDNNIRVKDLSSDAVLKIDRNHILKALNSIFIGVLEKTSFVEIDFNKQTNEFVLKHKAGFIEEVNRIPLKDVFKTKDIKCSEIVLQVYLSLLDDFGCILNVEANKISIYFPI